MDRSEQRKTSLAGSEAAQITICMSLLVGITIRKKHGGLAGCLGSIRLPASPSSFFFRRRGAGTCHQPGPPWIRADVQNGIPICAHMHIHVKNQTCMHAHTRTEQTRQIHMSKYSHTDTETDARHLLPAPAGVPAGR